MHMGLIVLPLAIECFILSRWADVPIFPFVLSCFVVLLFAERQGQLRPTLQRGLVVLNVTCVALFFGSVLNLSWLTLRLGPHFSALSELVFGVGMILTSCFVFVDPRVILTRIKNYPYVWILSLIAATSPILIKIYMIDIWDNGYGEFVSHNVRFFLDVLGYNVKHIGLSATAIANATGSEAYADVPGLRWIVSDGIMAISLIAPCGGFRILTYAIYLFSLIVLLYRNQYSIPKIFVAYIVGIGVVFYINIVRLVILFMILHKFIKKFGMPYTLKELFPAIHDTGGETLIWFFVALFIGVLYLHTKREHKFS